MNPVEPALGRTLAAFPAPIAGWLRELATTPGACAVVRAEEATAWARTLGVTVPELMLRLVGWAACHADVPISNYRVGAVARGLSGALYAGANLEFAGLPLSCSVHAEQSATTNAWVHGEQGLDTIAVSAAPCGYCRQFLYELVTAERLEILLPERPATPLSALLPGAFGPRDLGVAGGLMQPQGHGLVLGPRSARDSNAAGTANAPIASRSNDETRETIAAALAAANASYAPYGKTYAGVALRTADGTMYEGRYAESAAFNPSMSPAQAALAHLTLCGRTYADVVGAALVESSGPISQRAATAQVLAAVSPVTLTYARAVPRA
jgi:cytidine deaminase